MDRLDDLQVYRKLHAVVEDLAHISKTAWSPAAATAAEATAELVKALASGLWRNSLEASVGGGSKDQEKLAENCGNIKQIQSGDGL